VLVDLGIGAQKHGMLRNAIGYWHCGMGESLLFRTKPQYSH